MWHALVDKDLSKIFADSVSSLLRETSEYTLHAWAQFGGGRVPPLFQTGGHNMPRPTHFFLFTFYIWSGFKNKSDVCHVLCEELFMLNGRP